jgi:hypothetical protein
MRISKKDINEFPRFSFVTKDYYLVDSLCFFTGKDMVYLTGVLNSEFAKYYFYNNVAILDDGGMQMRQQFVELFPIPIATEKLKEDILDLIQILNISTKNYIEDKLNSIIYKLYAFSNDEIQHIKHFIQEKQLVLQES